tara:strand:- start:1161 stop:2156 length:996 start_codon:yes stop_codon:yes gene_type:complete
MVDLLKPASITMGDPAGIGPEIIVKALSRLGPKDRYIVFGCPRVIQRAIQTSSVEMVVKKITKIEEATFEPNVIEVLETNSFKKPPIFGKTSEENGKSAFTAVTSSIEHALNEKVSSIITAPINKESLALAGVKYPGHTEILADFSGVKNVGMLLANEEIRTVLVSIHCSLSDAINAVTFEGQMAAIRLANDGAKLLGYSKPRVAVAGLNPHAGESGLFGHEEIEIISPAIKQAQKEGILASGPWPGDTVFMQARRGNFDIVVAQYHDQGLIPVKFMGVDKGVNITLGLPFVRTSPDHGTAFDIAGQGIADATSLETAMSYAKKLVEARRV